MSFFEDSIICAVCSTFAECHRRQICAAEEKRKEKEAKEKNKNKEDKS